MKVLVVYHSGGLQNASAIYRELAAARNIELTVVAPEWIATDRVYDPSGRLQLGRHADSNGYRLISLPLVDPKKYNLGFETRPLLRTIKDIKADVVHVWDEPLSYCLFHVGWLRNLGSRKSKVLFYGFENTPFDMNPVRRAIWAVTWRQVHGGAAANSEALTNLKQAGFPPSRPTERIFWGISTEQFRPMDNISLKRDLRLDCDYIVGYVGRLVPEKGLAWLLAAVKRLPTNTHCLILGSGPMRGEIELWSELPSLAGRVHVLDAKPAEEMPRYINCMDVLVLPSLTTARWKEQYGRVIAEAMACGVPVVGSDSGAIPEVIGSAGLIVPESDTPALETALRIALFDGERKRLIQEGMRRAEQELSVQAMSRRLASFYERVLAG